jgi:hypothetical protein
MIYKDVIPTRGEDDVNGQKYFLAFEICEFNIHWPTKLVIQKKSKTPYDRIKW